MTMQHFLTLKDLSQRELEKIIKRAIELKQEPQQAMRAELKTLGLMFSKASANPSCFRGRDEPAWRLCDIPH